VGFKTPEAINRNWGGGWYHTFSPSISWRVRGGVATQPTEDAPWSTRPGSRRAGHACLAERAAGYAISWTSPRTGTSPRWACRAAARENPTGTSPPTSPGCAASTTFKPASDAPDLAPAEEPVRELIFNADPTRDAKATGSTGDVLAPPSWGCPARSAATCPTSLHRLPHLDPVGLRPGPVDPQAELTLTYGLRYDYITLSTVTADFQSARLPDGRVAARAARDPPVCSTVGNQPPCLPKPLDQIPKRVHPDHGRVQRGPAPIKDTSGRAWLAGRIDPKTVLRTGYALMWDSMVSRSQ